MINREQWFKHRLKLYIWYNIMCLLCIRYFRNLYPGGQVGGSLYTMRFSSSFYFFFFIQFFCRNNRCIRQRPPPPSSWRLVVTRVYDVLSPVFLLFCVVSCRPAGTHTYTPALYIFIISYFIIRVSVETEEKERTRPGRSEKKHIWLRCVYACVRVRGFGFFHQTFYQYLKRVQIRAGLRDECKKISNEYVFKFERGCLSTFKLSLAVLTQEDHWYL